MKKIILLSITCLTLLVSCQRKPQSSHEVRWDGGGKDSVVYVTYQGENGSTSNFFMNYMLYSMLFRQGGYGHVYNYYTQHPTQFVNSQNYTNYKPLQSSSYNKPMSTSSPSRITTSNNSSKSSWWTSNSNRSYSSPSRNSSSSSYKSYSSPSRSYSKSYSSPSRSYSSPSRSYSSPSRGR